MLPMPFYLRPQSSRHTNNFAYMSTPSDFKEPVHVNKVIVELVFSDLVFFHLLKKSSSS